MGSHVREAKAIAPPKLIKEECPHCRNKRRVINGAWLRWKREKAGIDQRTIANMLGFSGPYISDIERNRRECPASVIKLYRSL
jgi:DNA-binding transcriptional regulator YiaG